MTTDGIELSSFFDQPTINAEAYNRFADAVYESHAPFARFATLLEERLQSGKADPLRLALGLLILGRFSDALEQFERAPGSPERHYYAAEAFAGIGQFKRAADEYRQAAKAGWDAFDADLRVAAVLVRAGDHSGARKIIDRYAQAGQDRADWYYVRGLLSEAEDERVAALEFYERSVTLDPEHTDAMFRSARLYDMFGDDREALALYDGLTAQPRAHVNALLNATVIYEDAGQYEQAAHCVLRVLRAFPNHARARLFLKDIESCLDMIIDEVGEDRVDTRTRLLDTPLSEFELSVRARNCLKKMNIGTIGELMSRTEAELLAYKNFGETSLNEIKALLVKKGLRLGLSPDDVDPETLEQEAPAKPAVAPTGQQAILARPVSELELSVRARRCLQRLNILTFGDLTQYSEGELLAARNFGQTSLNEIKARLFEAGLQLAPKKTA